MLTIEIDRLNYEKRLLLTVVHLKPIACLAVFSETFKKRNTHAKMCGDSNIDHSKTNAKSLRLKIFSEGMV